MQDYKYDLETLKQNVKSKAKEDEAVFKKVLDEKGKFPNSNKYSCQKQTLTID